MDEELHIDWEIEGSKVRKDIRGQVYYKSTDGKYYDPGTDPEAPTKEPLTVGKAGKVLPNDNDKNVTHDKTEGAIMVITDSSGTARVIYQTEDGQLYYKAGDKYYSVMETIMTPGVDGFNPKYPADPDNPQANEDKPYETAFDIMVDEYTAPETGQVVTVYYYRNDKDDDGNAHYYVYAPEDPAKNGKPYSPKNPGSEDHTKFDVGTFNNKSRMSNITIKKQAVDKDENVITDGSRSGVFDYIIKFTNSSGAATDFDFKEKDYQFSPAKVTPSGGDFEKLDTGTYKFSLDAGQELKIYKVPLNTTYTISEPLSDESGEEMNLNGWEFVKIEGYEDYNESSHSKPTKKQTITDSRSVKKKIITDADDRFYEHTFSNRFTEYLVDKTERAKSTGTQSFAFAEKVELTGLNPNAEFSYGWMNEAESQFSKGTANDEGSATVNVTFNLKHKEDIALVVPQGAKVTVTETMVSDYITEVNKNSEAKEEKNTITENNIKDQDRITFHFTNTKVDPIEVEIPAEKILKGRPWKDSDEFAAALTLTSGDTTSPMPTEGIKEKDDKKYAEIIINNQDTPVKDDNQRVIGYKDNFGAITYKFDDLKDDEGQRVKEKTFKYHVRELEASETEIPPIPGVTYDTMPYNVEVTVKYDDTTDPNNPKLTYTIKYTDEHGSKVDLPNFTNTYDAEHTIYKMEAVKDYHDSTNGGEITLSGGEFEFVLKPIGEYADIAPMPKGTKGTGANRTYTKANEDDGDIQFEHEDDPDDGLKFDYHELLNAGVSDVKLHSAEGVDFEYEMYEVIPKNAVNNNDGTWIIEDRVNGIKYTYDGIHHTRKITVRVRTVTPDPPAIPYDELYIEGHGDDHKIDFYIDKDGKEKPASSIPGYDPSSRHFKEYGDDFGAPIFLNYYEETPGEIEGDETYGLKNQKQKGSPTYNVIPKNPVDKSTLKLVKPDKPGATISSDGKVVTIPGEGTYTLNSDGTITYEPATDYVGNPTPITVTGKDTRGNDVTGTYTPHVIDPTESATVKRTIKFTYEKKNGKKVTDSIVQVGTITRHALEVDPKTGQVTKWGPWSSYTFPAVKNPDKEAGEGWATKDIAAEMTVNGPGEVPDVYVIYHKTKTKDKDKDKDCPDCENGSGGAKTGDETNIALWIGLLAAAIISIVAVIIRRRRRDA